MSTVTSVPLPTLREVSDPPPLLIHPSARVLLTADMQATLDRLVELLENEARTQDIPISKVEVHGFVDPEEDTDSVIVTQWVAVPSQTALVTGIISGPRWKPGRSSSRLMWQPSWPNRSQSKCGGRRMAEPLEPLAFLRVAQELAREGDEAALRSPCCF